MMIEHRHDQEITAEVLNEALSKFQHVAEKSDFFATLESYDVNQSNMLENFEALHKALKDIYGDYHYAVERQIVKGFHRRIMSSKNEVRAETLSAYSRVLKVLLKDSKANLKNFKDPKIKNNRGLIDECVLTIGETARMVGHDIRNPLQSIENDVYLLKQELKRITGRENPKVEESLENIETNVKYIDKIVQDLVDFASSATPKLQMTSFEEVCNGVLAKSIFLEGVTVSCIIADDAKKVVTDPDFLSRMLSNLVTNAAQAMPNGGKIAIHASREPGIYQITVKDEGVGIPEENRSKLFKPLFTTKSKGQGFGLAVVKRLSEGLGGTVTFESEVNEGTTFKISLPQSIDSGE